MKKAYILIFTIFCVSCATPYQKQNWHTYTGGYSDTKLSNNNFVITFSGNGLLAHHIAKDYALLRSAEITINNGFKYFKIALSNKDTINEEAYNNIQNTTSNKPMVINVIYCYNDIPLHSKEIFYNAFDIIKNIKKQYNIE